MPWSILPKLQRFVIDGFIDHQKVEKERKKALQRWENSMMAAEDEFYREKLTFAEEKENQVCIIFLAHRLTHTQT